MRLVGQGSSGSLGVRGAAPAGHASPAVLLERGDTQRAAAVPRIPDVSPDRAREAAWLTEVQPDIEAFLTRWHQSSDAQRCVAIVTALRPHLSCAQARWLLDAIVLDGPPGSRGAPRPAAPMALTTCLALLDRCDPRPVRAPFHQLLAANLATSPLLEEATAALPSLPLDVLLRLSFHITPKHELRRALSEVIRARCGAVAEASDPARPDWLAQFLLPTIDRSDTALGMRVGTVAKLDGESLARDYLARGRHMVGVDFVAKADELRRLSRGGTSVTREVACAALRRELTQRLVSVVDAQLEASPLDRETALVAASHVPIHTADAYGEGRLLEQLATALRRTHGAVVKLVVELRDRDADARPELRKVLERSEGLPEHPTFPLQVGDRYRVTVFSNPLLESETSHELGHAYESARPEVLSAAVALRGMLAIGRARSLNDLAVIHTVATASGVPGMHEKLLRQLADLDEWPALDSAKALRAHLAGNGLEAVIDQVVASQDWLRLRPYGASEVALPIAAHPYLGKVPTDGSTEIVSVGFESLCNAEQLLEAYLDCPEHVLFTLGCLP